MSEKIKFKFYSEGSDTWSTEFTLAQLCDGHYDFHGDVRKCPIKISFNGSEFIEIDDCNFMTDYQMDIRLRDGYCDGWNNALSENGKHPSEKFKSLEEYNSVFIRRKK